MDKEIYWKLYELRSIINAQLYIVGNDIEYYSKILSNTDESGAVRFIEGNLHALDHEQGRHERALAHIDQIMEELEDAEE